jgi:peptidyl-prolyl cis-trans isomerase SurA
MKLRWLLFSCVLTLQIAFAAPVMLNGVAAVVNNSVITVSQLNDRVAAIKAQLRQQQIKAPAENVLQQQVLQMMISQELEMQTAQRMNLTASDADIRAFIKQIAQQQKMTSEQLRAAIAHEGMSEKQFLSDVRQQVINQKILREVLAPQITVTTQEIDTGLKMALSQPNVNLQYHLLHILVPLPASPTPEQVAAAQAKANNIMNQIQQGMDFKMLAAAESSGDQTFSGGDLGWKTLAELPTVFAENVTNMKVNQVVGPIQAANGINIIKLIGTRSVAKAMNKKQLKQEVANMIFQRKLQEKQESWLEELRAGAYVKILYNPDNIPAPM